VINRMQAALLPANVVPQISPQTPTGEIYRYTLSNPRDALGRPVYELRDLKSLQDFTLDREFKRIPRIGGTAAQGGEVQRYEVHPDPNQPVRVDNVVDGGPLLNPDGSPRVSEAEFGGRGVVVGKSTRLGRVGLARPVKDADGAEVLDEKGERVWDVDTDVVRGVVLLRKGAESLPALADLRAKVEELNSPGHMLPGVKIEAHYDRTDLINVTTETVQENLVVGLALVSMVLLMFLSNVRVALIVAVNIPLALLFAFGVLFARGKSANLLSIGAVDFGIIVDSTLILVESIYRHVTSTEDEGLTLKQKVVRGC